MLRISAVHKVCQAVKADLFVAIGWRNEVFIERLIDTDVAYFRVLLEEILDTLMTEFDKRTITWFIRRTLFDDDERTAQVPYELFFR